MDDPRKGIDEIYDRLLYFNVTNLPDKNTFYNEFQGSGELRRQVHSKLIEKGIKNLPDFETFEMKLYEQPTWDADWEDTDVSEAAAEKERQRTQKISSHELNKTLNSAIDMGITTPAGIVNFALLTPTLQYSGLPKETQPWGVQFLKDTAAGILKLSKDTQEWKKEKILEPLLPTDPQLEESFIHTTVPQAIGSFGGFAAFGLIGGLAGLPSKAAQYVVPILTGIGSETESILEDASRYDPDVMNRKDMSLLLTGGTISGTLEGLSMGRFLGRMGKIGAMPLIEKTVAFLKNPIEEGTQEWLQNLTENMTAKLTYDTTRELSQGALESAGAGAIVGLLFGSMGTIIQNKKKDPNLTKADETYLKKAEEIYRKQEKKLETAILDQRLSMNKFSEGISKTGDVFSALKGIAKNENDASGLLNAIEQHPDFLETQGIVERFIGKDVEKLTKAEIKHLTHLAAISKFGTVRQLLAEKGIVTSGEEANIPSSYDMYREVIANYTLKQIIPRRGESDESSKVPEENIKKTPSSETLREEEKTPELLKEINDISVEDMYFQRSTYFDEAIESKKIERIPVQRGNVKTTETFQIDWRILDVLRNYKNIPNYTKVNPLSLENTLKRMLPKDQVSNLMSLLKSEVDKGREKLTREDIVKLAEENFLKEVEIISEEYPGYSGSAVTDINQESYHVFHFGYPGAYDLRIKEFVDKSQHIKELKDLVKPSTNPQLFKVLDDLGLKVYDDAAGQTLPLSRRSGYVDPITKLLAGNSLKITMEGDPNSFFRISPEYYLDNILEAFVLEPIQLPRSDSKVDYIKLRVKDLLNGKRTQEEFTPLGDILNLTEYELDEMKMAYSNIKEMYNEKNEPMPYTAEEFYANYEKNKKSAFKAADVLLEKAFQKPSKEALKFDSIIEHIETKNPIAKKVLDVIKKEKFTLTGSISLSAFGTVYRDNINPHDIDVIAAKESFDKAFKKELTSGEMAHIGTIDEETGTTYSYALVPGGYKVGKLGNSLIIVDNNGDYSPDIDYVIVDIFPDNFKYPSVDKAGFKLADPRDTFDAKLTYGRLKDIQDMYQYNLTNPEFMNYYSERVSSAMKPMHFGDKPGTFGWVRGDITKDKIARIFEIQSDLFKHGLTKPVNAVEDIGADIFLSGVGEYDYGKFALQAAVNYYKSKGLSKVRIPLDKTVREIEHFNMMQGELPKIYQAVVDFYNVKMKNIAEKIYGSNAKIIIDKRGNPWIEINLENLEISTILFQKPTETDLSNKVVGNQKEMALNKRFEAKQLSDNLEKLGIADQTLKPLMDWLNETVGRIDVEIMDSNAPVGPNGELLNGNKGAYQQYKVGSELKSRIILNKDAFPPTRVGVYQTLVHELFHAATVNELKKNREFRDQITAIRNELNLRFKTDLKDAYKANQAEFDIAMGEGLDEEKASAEFISHIMSGTTSRFKQLLKETAVSNYSKQSILDKVIRIISNFMHKAMGLKPKSFHDALEIQLQRFVNLRTDFEQIPSSDVVDYTNSQEIQDRIEDKLLTMREEALTDPSTIESIGKIVAASEGEEVSDYYKYLKLKSKDQIMKIVGDNPQWKSAAIFHYQKNFTGTFPSFEAYKEAVLTQFYNHITNLEKRTVVRLTKTYRKQKWDDKVEPEINIVEFNDTYRDAERKAHSVYKPATKLDEILPIMEKALGVSLELVYIDRVETRNIVKGRKSKAKQTHIASQDYDHIQDDGTETRNEDYTRYLNKLGYYFPGTWADKKTVIAFKVKGEQTNISKVLKSFRDLYSQKSKDFVKFMVTKDYGKEVWESIETSEDPRLKDWLTYAQSTAQSGAEVMRLIAEDIRLGGVMTAEGWKSALYNPNDPNTYDAIKMFKRPYLVAEKSYVHLDKKKIDYKLNHTGFNHGMEWSNNELMTSAVIFNAEPKSGQTSVEYKGKLFDISQILIDTFGDATTDGKIVYVLGGFDEIYRSSHGTYHKGSIKAFIANRFNVDNFNTPFYVKGAFHGISKNEPLAQWMIKNNITFLISSTAAKVNSYPVDNLYSSQPSIVKIPFKEIHRDHEKSSAKLSARGFAQTLTANYAVEANPAFVDEGWTEAINEIIDNLHKKFKKDMHDLTPSGVLEYLKDKAFNGSSDYERTASKAILSMAYTKLDQQYANITDVVDRLSQNKLLSDRAKERAAQILDKWQNRYVNFSDQQAKKISNIFHDPYFTELLRGKIRDSIEYITRFKIPATWAVLDSDMGFLTARRYELIERHVKDLFINKKKKAFADKGAKIIDKLHQLNQENLGIVGMIEGNPSDTKLIEMQTAVLNDIENYTKQYEEYYKDEKINYDSNQFKESVKMNDENRVEINKMLGEIVDLNTGRLKPGYVLITSDIANRMKVKTGDKFLFDRKQNKIIVAAVPSDSILSASGPTIVGIMSPQLSEPGKIIMNSEYAQGILGKDFDIDTMYLTFADKDMMSEEVLEKMTNSLNKTIEKHKKKMLSEYRKELRNNEFIVRRNIEKTDGTKEWVDVRIPGNKLEYQDILKKEVRLAYTQKFNGVKQGGRTLFNPAGEGRFLLNEYRKDIAKIVNRRKKLTTKSQINLTTTIDTPYGRIKINPRHKKAWQTYMLLLNMTNDMVDVPTNTNKFFYNYDEIKAFDQDNGTKLFDLVEVSNETVRAEIENFIDTIDQVERFLFGYGIGITTERNLDKFGDERTMEDELKYIKQQQQINRLIDTKNFVELNRQFRQWYELNNQYRDELEVEKAIGIGEEYITNMNVGNTNLSPVMRSINLFDENDIPAISMSEEEYIATQADMVTSMLTNPKWKSIKEAFDKVLQNKHLKDIINKIPKSSYAINKEGFEKYTSNNMLAQLFFMTAKNPDLHLLKAAAITIINPENQTTYKKELLEPLRTNPTSGVFLDSIYQLANEISYPKLVRMLFKNRSIAFKEDVMQFGKAIRFRNLNGHLQIEVDHKGQTYKVDSTELPNRSEELWKRTANYIFGDMFKDPENRVKLTDMLELGGENTQITERIAVTAEMLSQELPKYSRFDRLLFWTSLLGKPSNNMRKTTNFILPRTRKKGFYSQERLYQTLVQTNEEIANHFMYAYAPSFSDNFRGLNFYENMKIAQLQIDPQVFGEAKQIETWYQGDMHEAMDEVEDQDTNFKTDFESIYDIARQEEKNIPDTNNPVGIVLNMESQMPEFIYNIDVMNTFSKYVTNVTGAVNKSMVALTKALSVNRSVNIIKNREFLRDAKIERLLNDMLAGYHFWQKRGPREAILTEIHNIEETNPYNIIIEKNIGGSYTYYTPNRAESYPDTKAGLNQMFSDLGIPKRDMKKHQIALEYQKRYSIDHIEDLDTMIDYFETLMRTLPKDFGRADVLEGILYKYRTLRKQFDKQMFKYFPRVYEKQVAYDVFRKENEAQIEADVRQKNPNLPEKEITDLIEREIADRFSNLSYDNYTNYVHSWMLNRKLVDGDRKYIKNSLLPHQIHQRQFLSMIQNDVLLSDWILYEHDAAADGTPKDIINKIHRWYGFISDHKLLRTKTIDISEAKEGDGVHFYYRQKKKDSTYADAFIRGTVDTITDDIVKVKINPERMEKRINAELADKRKEHDEIVRQGNKPATPTQLERLAQFYEEGFIEKYKSNISKLDANDKIIEGYENMLGKRENWGRFERKNVYIKQYEGAEVKMIPGFYQEQNKKSIADKGADFFNQLSSVAFLGGPSGGTRNFIDASWALQRDLRGWRYWRDSFGATVFALNVYLSKKSGELDKFRPAMISAIDEWSKQQPDLGAKELQEAAEGFATDYIIKEVLYKANLGDITELKGETFASKLQKLVKAGKATGEAITYPFRMAEKLVRCQAAYMYARKAIIDDGITDPKLIRLAIEKGVARTQSLYDSMHRKLGEDSSFGALLFKFSQYNSFQLQMTMLEIEQAKRLGIKFNPQNMFSRTITSIDQNGVKRTHKAGDTIDPNIANRMLVDFWIDTFGITLGTLTPGFRASSPVNKAVAMPLSFLAQMLVFGEDPDDWDLRDWAYGISAFFLGLGFTLPIQVLANLSGKWGLPIPLLTNDEQGIIPINPRIAQFGIQLYEMIVDKNGDPQKRVEQSVEQQRQLEKFFFSFNIITPTSRRYYSENQKDFNSRSIIEKPLYFFENDRWLFTPIPILNIAANQ